MVSSGYIQSLTPLRGIAALWVVLFHIDVSLYYRDLGALAARDATGIFSKGYLWVDFFFLLSGFIIAHVYGESLSGDNKWRASKSYLWTRFTRLYPLHLFTLMLLLVGSSLTAHYFPQLIDASWTTYFSWAALPDNLLFTNAMNQHVYLSWNMVSWSIGAEWWTYVVAIIFLIALRGRSLLFIFPFMLIAFGGLGALVYSLPDRNLDITFNYGFLRCLIEFALGSGVYVLYQRQIGFNWLKRDSAFAALMIMVGAVFHFKLVDLLVIPLFILLLLAVSYNTTAVARCFKLPLLQYLGTISYSVYLMHGVWFMVFWFSLPHLKSTTGMAELPVVFKLMYVVLFLGVTLVSAHFTYHHVEVAGRRWLNRFNVGRVRELKPEA